MNFEKEKEETAEKLTQYSNYFLQEMVEALKKGFARFGPSLTRDYKKHMHENLGEYLKTNDRKKLVDLATLALLQSLKDDIVYKLGTKEGELCNLYGCWGFLEARHTSDGDTYLICPKCGRTVAV